MLELALDEDNTADNIVDREDEQMTIVSIDNSLKIEHDVSQSFQEIDTDPAQYSQPTSPSIVKDEYVQLVESDILKQEVDENQQETFELEEEYLIEEDMGEEHYEIDIIDNEYDPDIVQKKIRHFITEKIVVENLNKSGKSELSQQFVYKCTTCDKLYDKKTSLQYHMKTKHSDDRQYQCTVCTKAFAIKSDYVRHSRIHTNEKRYCCSTCGKKFTDRSTHLKHERIHTGSKPYECTICGKSFGYSFVLKNHILTHTGVKEFACPVCEKAFARKSKMKDHARRVHKKEITADGELIDAGVKVKVEKSDLEGSVVTIACPT